MGQKSSSYQSQRRYEMADHSIIKGGFAHVRRCHDSTRRSDVAMKTIPFETRKNGLPSYVLREISVLKDLEHENVVRLHDVICTPNDFKLYFEWLDDDLHKSINRGPFDSKLIKSFLFQILQGVCYCHSHKVLHRDLKPQNLLLNPDNYKLKLADFGLARTFDCAPAEYSTDVGTIAYKAPELLLNMRQSTTAVDIWSVGCIFAEMVNGSPLFGGGIDMFVVRNIIRILGVPSEIEWPGIESACLDVCGLEELPSGPIPNLQNVVPLLESEGVNLLREMLRFMPDQRITAHEALKHPYFDFHVLH